MAAVQQKRRYDQLSKSRVFSYDLIDRYQVVLFLHSVISKESLQSELVKDDDVFSAEYYVVHTSKYSHGVIFFSFIS